MQWSPSRFWGYQKPYEAEVMRLGKMRSKLSAPRTTETGKYRKKIIGGLNRIMETSGLLNVKNLTKKQQFYFEKYILL